MTIAELKDRFDEVVSNPLSSPEEVEAAQKALAEAEKYSAPLSLPDTTGDLPPILDSAIRDRKIGAELNAADVMSRADYEEIVSIAHGLGIDALRVGQLYSQLEAVCKEQSNTRIGLFALRTLVENCYLHRKIGEMSNVTLGAVQELNRLHAPKPVAEKNGKKKR